MCMKKKTSLFQKHQYHKLGHWQEKINSDGSDGNSEAYQ
jgi:hypothetical protein